MTDPLEQLTPQTHDGPSRSFSDRLRVRVQEIEAPTGEGDPPQWHLAQLNIGYFKKPLDHPDMQDFVNGLERINGIAEASPGFIWRLTDADGASSSFVEVPGATDPMTASNLSVWTDLEALRGFMYKTDHVSYLRRKAEWFDHKPEALTVLWWIPAGTTPTLEDAVRRLEVLQEQGPTEQGWTLRKPLASPSR